jgi:hypothetical protein
MKKSLIMGLTAVLSAQLFSQNIDDAVRYQQYSSGGSALSIGMGGATGAVGADFSSASTNPAGMGLYRQSEFIITPGIFNTGAKSDFYGSQSSDNRYNFNISSLGLVLHYPNPNRLKTRGWLGTTLSFGYNRQTSLHQQWLFRGVNSDGSIVGAFAELAEGKSPEQMNQFDEFLAYNSFLIDPVNDTSNTYTSLSGPLNGGQTQRVSNDARGRIGESLISFAGNYSNRLYVGASLSIRRIIFEQESNHSERDEMDTIPAFTSMNFRRVIEERGTALGLRLGAIYRVNDWFRIGGAALIPFEYSMRSTFSSSMDALFDSNESLPSSSPINEYSYKLRTAPRFTGSAAFFWGKRGMLSIDYESVQYAATRFIANTDIYDNLNDRLNTRLRASSNIRAGVEARFEDTYLRGGYQLQGNPFSSSSGIQQARNQFSFGGGFRNDEYFFDAAYVYSTQSIEYFPYNPTLQNTQAATLNLRSHYIVFSIGSRF